MEVNSRMSACISIFTSTNAVSLISSLNMIELLTFVFHRCSVIETTFQSMIF